MPTRMVRNWNSSEKVNKLSFEAEVFFIRLITTVDDFGRFHANPMLLKAALFPLRDVSIKQVEKWIYECSKELINVYKVDGKMYLEIIDFNQRLRLKNSKFPQMTDTCQTNDGQMTDTCRLETETEVEEETEEETEKPEIEKKFNFRISLIDYGFDKILVKEWMQVRKAKKAVNSETAFHGFIKEIQKVPFTDPNEILRECVERSWSGFKAEWLNNINSKNNGKPTFEEAYTEFFKD